MGDNPTCATCRKRRPIGERFWEKVQKTDECWLWVAGLNADGYGMFESVAEFGTNRAHRVAWIMANGPIPQGMQLDHLCRVRSCVNPAHLEVVTNKENILRSNGWGGVSSRRAHCPKGHPYSGDNLRVGGGRRHCVACVRESTRNRMRRIRQSKQESPDA